MGTPPQSGIFEGGAVTLSVWRVPAKAGRANGQNSAGGGGEQTDLLRKQIIIKRRNGPRNPTAHYRGARGIRVKLGANDWPMASGAKKALCGIQSHDHARSRVPPQNLHERNCLSPGDMHVNLAKCRCSYQT